MSSSELPDCPGEYVSSFCILNPLNSKAPKALIPFPLRLLFKSRVPSDAILSEYLYKLS